MTNEYVLAGDLGGTNLRIGAVSNDGSILQQLSTPTPLTGSAGDIADAIATAARDCVKRVGSTSQPIAFCLALAALVNSKTGRILRSPNIRALDDQDLAAPLSAALDVPVVLENDATAAAIGEHWLGSTKDAMTSVFVTLGTGVGGGLIIEGKPFRGIDGTAGEVGHIVVEPEGVPCGCGGRGCVEQYASATAIVRIAKELAGSNHTATSIALDADLTAEDIYRAAIAGDAVAARTFAVMGRYLGVALAGLVDVLNPEVIAIGGGVAAGWEAFVMHVRSEIDARAFPTPARRVRLVQATLGNTAGLLGAARVALDHSTPRSTAFN